MLLSSIRIYLIGAWICLFGHQLCAQDVSPFISSVIPPSPEVSSLGKFGDVPVGLHTGVAQISVPIYTLKVRDIEFPISLDYHAGGIRVEEIASCAGLGFALNAGGAVFSTVNGYPDLGPAGFISTYSSHPDFMNFNPVHPQDPIDYVYAKDVCIGDIDSEPDIFHFNFLGRAGKFTFDAQQNIHPIPFQKIKITRNPPFQIQDEHGNRYYFYHAENLHVTSDGCNQPPGWNIQNTTYKLSKIESAQGAVITINYKPIQYAYPLDRTLADYHDTQIMQAGICGFPPSPVDCSKTANVNGWMISSIESNDGTIIEFKYSDEIPITYNGATESSRRDLPGTFALRKIIVRHTSSTIPAKEFTLSYDYHVSPFAPSPYSASNADYYRLLLKSVQETGKPPYELSYNEAVKMHNRLSAAQDHWGYFNGKWNTNLLPSVYVYGHGEIPGANREPDPQFAQSLVLKEMTYPTGGRTEFSYESNYYNPSEGETKIVVEEGGVGVGSSTGEYSITFDMPDYYAEPRIVIVSQCPGSEDPGRICYLTLQNNDAGTPPVSYMVDTTLPSLSPGNYTLRIQNEGCDCNGGLIWKVYRTVPVDVTEKVYVGGLRISKIASFPGSTSAPVIKRYLYDIPGTTKSSGYFLHQPTYTYEIGVPVLYMDDYTSCSFMARTASSILPLGGIQGSSMGYQYVTELLGENGEFGKSVHEFKVVRDIPGDPSIPMTPSTNYDWLRGLLISKTDFAYDENNVTTPFKKVRQVTNEYKIKHHYEDFFGFRNGLFDNEQNIVGLKILMTKPEYYDPSNPLLIKPATFRVTKYKNVSAWFYLEKTIETLEADTDSKIVNETQFFYDAPAHAQLTKQEHFSSGKTVIAEYTYPADYTSVNSGAIAEMKGDFHMHGFPVEIVTKVRRGNNTTVTGGTFTTYDFVGEDDAETPRDERHILPTIVKSAEIDAPKSTFSSSIPTGTAADESYKDKMYMSYDPASARLVQTRKASDMPVALVWGYDNALLIAEVKNASNDQVYHTSFEDTGTADGASKTGRKCFIGDYTFVPPTGFVPAASSTLSYWYWSDDSWHYKEIPYSGGSVTLSDGDKIDEVRIYPPKALMTTYTHDPLIGVTSMTDANNVTVYYKYDNVGRLVFVKNAKGEIISSYEYHYKDSE